MKTNDFKELNRYFNNDVIKHKQPKGEVEYISSQLRAMDKEDISEAIAQFGLEPLRVFLAKHKKLENTFSFLTLEPFMEYLDSYLIEKSGGNVEELKKLSMIILGEEMDHPTARLMRLGILNKYFKTYMG